MKISLSNGKEIFSHVSSPKRVVIGRSRKKCEFTVSDESLSRTHCTIEYDGENIYVTDLGSANGVFIDRKRIEPHTRILYRSALSLHVADFECLVELDPTSAFQAANHQEVPGPKEVEKRPKKETPRISEFSYPQKKRPQQFVIKAFLAFAVVMGFIFAYSERNVSPVSQVSGELPTTAPVVTVEVKALPKGTLSTTSYMSLTSLVHCNSSESFICQTMGLDARRGEGVWAEGQRLFIYIVPVYHLEGDQFKAIRKNPLAPLAISILQFLKSSVDEDVSSGKYNQVQIVLLNRYRAIDKVLHFELNGKTFLKENVRQELEKSLQDQLANSDGWLKHFTISNIGPGLR